MSCTVCPLKKSGVCLQLTSEFGEDYSKVTYTDLRGRSVITREGSEIPSAMVLCRGHAVHMTQLADGRRQILSLRRPGQLLMGVSAFANRAGFSVVAVTDVRIASISTEVAHAALTRTREGLAVFLEEFQREHQEHINLIVDLGRRNAMERICHLFCKLIEWEELPVENNQCAVRLTLRQEDMADLLGLTTTHVNRTISALRKSQIITLHDDKLKVLDYQRMRMMVG